MIQDLLDSYRCSLVSFDDGYMRYNYYIEVRNTENYFVSHIKLSKEDFDYLSIKFKYLYGTRFYKHNILSALRDRKLEKIN